MSKGKDHLRVNGMLQVPLFCLHLLSLIPFYYFILVNTPVFTYIHTFVQRGQQANFCVWESIN